MTNSDDLTRPNTLHADGSGFATGATTPNSGFASGASTDATRASGAFADGTDSLTTQETRTLISADKVQGTAVYNSANDRLGTVDQIMLNKQTGVVAYAVMSFGGFLGIGERYHMLPWNVLTYDVDRGGYSIDLDLETLKGGPTYSRDELTGFDYDEGARSSDSYYGSTGTYPLPRS